MITRLLRLAVMMAIGIATGAMVRAQDPVVALPDSHELRLDNEWVTVVRVNYQPGARLAAHSHAEGTKVFVYLSDSDQVVYRHANGITSTRPPVKRGDYRVNAGPSETHTVENHGANPAEFLRVIVKTAAKRTRMSHRFAHSEYSGTEVQSTVDFQNPQLRASRLLIPKHKKFSVHAAAEPALVVVLSSGKVAIGPRLEAIVAGAVRWIAQGTTETYSGGSELLELIRIDFVSRP